MEAANKSLYVDMQTCFSEIASNPQFNVTARDEARTLMGKLTKFETILTAATFNRIFAITTPLSEYLQNKGLDILRGGWLSLPLKNLEVSVETSQPC